MSTDDRSEPGFSPASERSERLDRPRDEIVPATVVEEPPVAAIPPSRPFRLRWRLPLALFVGTCLSTYYVGGRGAVFEPLEGLVYAAALMTILVCHELGHFVQTRRYGVPSSLPLFLPMPISVIGTMGAVILMDSRVKNRKALFDIGISGPLAGLVPTLACVIVGLHYSHVLPRSPNAMQLGDPLLFKFLSYLVFGPLPEGHDIYVGRLAMAGWVGLLITAINLFPIGQLDGGHVLYALLRRRAHRVATAILFGAIAAIAVSVWWFEQVEMAGWSLMVILLLLMGPRHPPTGDDDMPLGWGRILLGWLTLAFLIVGFTPNPFPQP
jgi:membrane-associated protease RseP (regulator of RpoE activity)